jgi:hypothetical protein
MKQIAEDEHVQAWAEILADILELVPPEQREEVLQLLSPNVNEMDVWRDEIVEGTRAWEAGMRLRLQVTQALMENICANLSPEEGAAVLYERLKDNLPVHLLP